jgi:hypothetical protein
MYYTLLLTYAEAVKKSYTLPSAPCAPSTMLCTMHYALHHDTPCPMLFTSSATSSDCSTISRRHRSKHGHKCYKLRHIRQECLYWCKSHHF